MNSYQRLMDHLSRNTVYSCRYEPRCMYHVYVPSTYDPAGHGRDFRLVVLIHGTERSAELYRDHFRAFAKTHNLVVLAPLFPAGLIEPDRLENYNHLRLEDIFFDQILLKMIDELGQRFPLNSERFFLHGFSGGGQFCHRFFYLYPRRLAALSVGAPGEVTFLEDKDWPLGTKGWADKFGRPIEEMELSRVPVQIVVGEKDTTIRQYFDRGQTRLERAGLLLDNYRAGNIETRLDVVPGAGHEGLKMLPAVMDFFREHL